jgi:protein phosphatase
VTIDASARSHAGRVRTNNEDAAVCRPDHGLFVVIDGMGGQEAGEVAAAIAAAALSEVPNVAGLAGEAVLSAAMKEARLRILHQVEKDPSTRDMGAVATAVRLDDAGKALSVAHVGDTRAWLVGARGVRQLTHDHVAEGEAGSKRPVARDLGRRTMEGEWVETARFPFSRGDLLILATDGLHDAVPDAELAAELSRLWREGTTADAISSRLIALALARGGPDNVTVVAARLSRFRRGQRRARLGIGFTVGLFLAITALAIVALLGRRPAPLGELPDRVATDTLILAPPPLTVEAAKATTVSSGAALELRGVRVGGVDWRIDIADRARATLDLTAVELEGAFLVYVGKDATLELRDTRVDAGSIRIVTQEGAKLTFRHVLLQAGPGGGPEIEGPAARDTDQLELRSADGAPNTPSAPAEGDDEGAPR